MLPKSGQEEGIGTATCMFLCGVMWCGFGRQDAGKELLRVATSMDPEMRVPARAMWAKGALRLRNFEGRAKESEKVSVV